ncbi:permease [Natranaerofaba carboxydovora]|uniref:permease n=1 Tax=Natranaerofaba carboxydovora TaxID=2742683 RepID=UPI001F12DD89|nr:permease [Natranaerofaba carboxydovora]UMZ72760.1 putative permease [Natranaerofaba carboxydovora]
MELIVIYSIFGIAFTYSIVKDKEKTKQALMGTKNISMKLLPSILIIIGLVGLLLGFVPPETIKSLLGEEAGFAGTATAGLLGSLFFIPNIVAVPLVGSLLRSGASIMTAAAFLTTLTMVGTMTAPVEVKELGKKYTLFRNLLSFIFALVIAIIMGLIL